MTDWLHGKRTLVVGGGSGIGRAVVDAFRAEGARITVLERDRAKCDALREELSGVPVIEGDAVTREANEHAVKVAVDSYGGLDTLVNCVGIFDFYRGVNDIKADELSPAQRERVGVIRESGKALLAILNDVLDLSKVEAGKLQLEPVEFYMGELATAVCSTSTGASSPVSSVLTSG